MNRILLLAFMLVALPLCMYAQTRTITGKVLDAKGAPVPKASITIKNTGKGVAANNDGVFTISAKPGDIIVITGVGFETKEITVGSSSTLDVELSASTSDIGTVVVTGYGSQVKKKFAGSATTVAINDVRTQPIASFDQILQGQGPGISVLANSGQPGAPAVVRIRGTGSVSGSSTPLYIVDGIQITAGDFATLNPGDFESVNILKDATATALYGSRGSNGVIVITTRKGRAGVTRINYDVQQGWSFWPENTLKVMNGAQKIDYEIQRGNPYGWSAAEQDSLKKINTDWSDVLFRTGMSTQHMLSASGGNDRSTFYASLSYLDQQGIVRTTNLKRYTGRLNLDNNHKNLKFGLNLQIGYSAIHNTGENDEYIGTPLNAIRWANPYERPYDPNTGEFQDIVSGQPNPLRELLLNKSDFPQVKGIGSVYIQYSFPWINGLSIKTNWGGDYLENESTVYLDRRTYTGSLEPGSDGSLLRQSDRNFRYTGTTSLNYKRNFDDHELEVGLYNEIVKSNFSNFGFTGYGLVNGFENEAGITPGTGTNGYIPIVGGNGTQNALLSYFATINYGYKGKYYVTLVGRRDGSSRFGVNNRFANFGSAGVSWAISDEKFFENIRSVDDLRLRVSYGSVGNQSGIADFANLAKFGRNIYAGTNGLVIVDPGNPDLKWETSTTFNAGIDFSLFRKRLSGTVEFYNKLTTDLLYARQISGTTGFTTITGNEGSMRNRGVEVNLQADIIRTGGFKWNVDLNLTYNQNRIISLPNGEEEILSGINIIKKGLPLNTLYLVKYAGVDATNGDALYYKKDGKTVTNVYDPADRVPFGTSDAPWFGGIGTTISYKGFEVSASFNYFLNRDVFNVDRINVENPSYYFDNMSVDLLNEWQNPGDVTNIPSPNNPFFSETSRFLEDGSFWRLRNVMVSYDFSPMLKKSRALQSLRIFVQGQNLWTQTKFRGFDPEVTGSILTGAQYPAMRQVTMGLSVGF